MGFAPFLRRHAVLCLKGAKKREIVAKSAEPGDFADGNRRLVEEAGAGEKQALAGDILAHAVAGRGFEAVHEIGAADVGGGGELVNRERFRQMIVDVGQKLLDLFIGDRGGAGSQFVIEEGAVEENHKFDEQHFGIKRVGEAMAAGGALQLFHVKEQIVSFPGGEGA